MNCRAAAYWNKVMYVHCNTSSWMLKWTSPTRLDDYVFAPGNIVELALQPISKDAHRQVLDKRYVQNGGSGGVLHRALDDPLLQQECSGCFELLRIYNFTVVDPKSMPEDWYDSFNRLRTKVMIYPVPEKKNKEQEDTIDQTELTEADRAKMLKEKMAKRLQAHLKEVREKEKGQ